MIFSFGRTTLLETVGLSTIRLCMYSMLCCRLLISILLQYGQRDQFERVKLLQDL